MRALYALDRTRNSPHLTTSSSLPLLVLAGVLLIAFCLIPTAPASYALPGDTCNVGSVCSASASPSTGTPGSTFAITTSVTVPTGSVRYLQFLAVVAPNFDAYICGPSPSFPCSFHIVAASGTSSCAIPFGGPGALSSSGPIGPCVALNTNSWGLVHAISAGFLQALCTGAGAVPPFGTTSVGSTSQVGTYTVVACWALDFTGSGGVFATNTFTVSSSATGVPQFPLGLWFVLAVGVPALLLIRRMGINRP